MKHLLNRKSAFLRSFLFFYLISMSGCTFDCSEYETDWSSAEEVYMERMRDLFYSLGQERNLMLLDRRHNEPFSTIRVCFFPPDSISIEGNYGQFFVALMKDISPNPTMLHFYRLRSGQETEEISGVKKQIDIPTYSSYLYMVNQMEQLSAYSIKHQLDSNKKKINFSIQYCKTWPKDRIYEKMKNLTESLVKTLSVFEYGSHLVDTSTILGFYDGRCIFDTTVNMEVVKKRMIWNPRPPVICDDAL